MILYQLRFKYESGDEFKPNANDCRYTCVCVNGDIGCYPTCSNKPPPEVTTSVLSVNPFKFHVGSTEMSKNQQ